MRGLDKALFVAAVCAAGAFAMRADAGTKVQGNMVPQNLGGICGGGSDPCFTIGAKPGKFKVSESKKTASAGIEIQLNVKGIDCADAAAAGYTAANDGGQAGKCTDVSHTHVLEVNTDFSGLETKVGLRFDLVKGKTVFVKTGKNKVTGGDAFGPLAGVIQGQTLGIGVMRMHAPGTNPASCDSAPLTGTDCIDGEKYGISGIIASNEAGTAPAPCTMDSECSITQICSSGSCVNETCSQDSDCANFTGGGGDVTCNEDTGTCCLLGIDTDPNCDVE